MGSISILSTNYAVKRKILREKNLVRAGIRTGAAGWEARLHPLCYAAPSSNVFYSVGDSSDFIESVLSQSRKNRQSSVFGFGFSFGKNQKIKIGAKKKKILRKAPRKFRRSN